MRGRPDYELWQVLHADCPPGGCGGCVEVGQIDLPQEVFAAAKAVGMSMEAFVHMAVDEGVREVLSRCEVLSR